MTFLERYFPRGCSFWTGRKLYFEKQQRQTKRSQQNLFDALVVHTDETDQQLLNTPRENLRAEQLIRRDVLEREGKVKDGQQLTWRNRSRDKDKLKELRELAGEARERLPKMLRIADLSNATIAVLDRIAFIIRQEKRTKISYTELEKRLPCSLSAVQRAVKLLEKMAILLVKREKGFRNGKPCNEINEYSFVRYKDHFLQKPDRLTADNAFSFSEGGSVNVETHSVENFNSLTTDNTGSVSKGVRAHRGKAPARTSSKENPHKTAKASSQIKSSSGKSV